MATAPAIMEVDSVFGREAIEPDLSSYARQWRFLLQKEVEAPYGPIQPEPDDIQELRRKGTWIPDVTLHVRVDCIEARWTENVGHNIVQGTDVVISRTHPKVDKLRTCTVTARAHRRLLLRAWSPDPDIEMGTWRLDVEVNWVPYYRVNTALHHFTSLSPPSPPSILQVLIGSCVGNSQQRRALNEVTGGALGADMSALLPLNDSQRNAVQRSLAQRVLLIQGPPGTGKTEVAEAIFRVWKGLEVQGPAVGAAPSNVAADNLAKRLLKTTILDVKRYGPPDKIKDVVEATGGILFPWRLSAGVVVRQLTDLFGLSRVDVLEAVQNRRACSPVQNLLHRELSARAERGRPSAKCLRYHSRQGSASNHALYRKNLSSL